MGKNQQRQRRAARARAAAPGRTVVQPTSKARPISTAGSNTVVGGSTFASGATSGSASRTPGMGLAVRPSSSLAVRPSSSLAVRSTPRRPPTSARRPSPSVSPVSRTSRLFNSVKNLSKRKGARAAAIGVGAGMVGNAFFTRNRSSGADGLRPHSSGGRGVYGY